MKLQGQSYLAAEEIQPTQRVPLDRVPLEDLRNVPAVERRIKESGPWGENWRDFTEAEKLAVIVSHQAGRVRLFRLTYVCPSGPVNGETWVAALME